MPMYDFECTQCGHIFEEVVPSSAANPPCSECQAATERLVGAPFVGVGKEAYMSPQARRYLNKDFQGKLKEKASKQGKTVPRPK